MSQYEIKNHLLYIDGNRSNWQKSPNVSNAVIEPELIVIHYTGDNGLGGLRWLCDPQAGVSAHLWIAKTGQIWQLVPFNIRAWHAGRSEWNGRSDCNSWSIGIENQGIGDNWPEAQVKANIDVIIALMKAYPGITEIVGHEDVAPGRKGDPGPNYPWNRIEEALKEIS